MGYGIDFGATALRAVRVERTLRGFRVVGAARRRLSAAEGEDRAALARALRETLAGAGGVSVVGLSGRDINLQVVVQPNMKPANYRAMMGYELEQRRGDAGELYGDYVTLREPDPYFPNYLAMVGIGKKTFVDERLTLAAAGGLDLRDAVPVPFALFEAYRNAYGAESGTSMLVDIGAETMNLVLSRGGRMIFCRNVSTGARVFDQSMANMSSLTMDEAEARKILYGNLGPPSENPDPREEESRPPLRTAAVQLAGAITSSITFARHQLGDRELTVDRVYVSGGGARLRGLSEYLQSALKVPVEPLDAFRNLDLGALRDNEEFKALPTDMATAIGLALTSTQAKAGQVLSILPDRFKKRRDFFRGPVFTAAAGIALAAALVTVTAVGMVRKAAAQNERDKFASNTRAVGERLQKLDDLERELVTLVAKRRILELNVAPGRLLLDTAQKLRRILPGGIYVRSLELKNVVHERAGYSLPRRVVYAAPGRGIVEGVIPSSPSTAGEPEPEVRVRLVDAAPSAPEETFPREVVEAGTTIDAPWLGIEIVGEIDESIKGGVTSALEDLKLHLSDPSRRVSAEFYQEGVGSRSGWQTFRIIVRQD